THYTAVQQDYLHGMIHQLSKDKQLEYLKKNIDLPHYDVKKFEYKESKAAIPAIDEHLELNALNYASVTGKRLFITPNIITRSSVKLKPDEKRKYPVSLNFEYRDVDTAVIEIPAGYTVENMPAPVKIESKFGKYSAFVDVKPIRSSITGALKSSAVSSRLLIIMSWWNFMINCIMPPGAG